MASRSGRWRNDVGRHLLAFPLLACSESSPLIEKNEMSYDLLRGIRISLLDIDKVVSWLEFIISGNGHLRARFYFDLSFLQFGRSDEGASIVTLLDIHVLKQLKNL